MKNIKLIISVILLISLLQGIEYPEWFVKQYKYPDITVAYRMESTEFLHDASITYSMCRQCQVKGELYLFPDIEKRNSEYYFYYDEKDAEKSKSKFIYLAGHVLKAYPTCLVAAFSIKEVELSGLMVEMASMGSPAWVKENAYEDNNYFYGIGAYSSRGNIVDAWKTAERRSIYSILSFYLTVQHDLKIYYQDENESQLQTYQAFNLNHTLKGIEFCERWHDMENHVVYVLSRVKSNNISSPYLDKTSKKENKK